VEIYSEDSEYLSNLFQTFKKNQKRNYNSPKENEKRLNIFKNNAKLITAHNRAYLKGAQPFYQRINEHSDKVF